MDYLLQKHFVTLFLIAGFSMKLWNIRSRSDRQIRWYWLTTLCVLLLVLSDTLEVFTGSDPSMCTWRTLFSVIGYALRPVAALSIVMAICPNERDLRVLFIPGALNAALCVTAFFSPLVFSFNETYHFVRGPLGFVPFAVSLFYIACAVWMTRRFYRQIDHSGKRYLLYLCAAACLGAVALDVGTGTAFVNASIMVSAVFLYIFLRSYDTSTDPLTRLLNRQAFYEDLNRYRGQISAVGSVDMNGLKTLNDTRGHQAGDEALQAIGAALRERIDGNTLAYRVGGDEFVMLFMHAEEEQVRSALEQVRAQVSAGGYTVSVGYAMRSEPRESMDDLIRRSDQSMYADKAAFYSRSGHNRRRRSDDRPREETPAAGQ